VSGWRISTSRTGSRSSLCDWGSDLASIDREWRALRRLVRRLRDEDYAQRVFDSDETSDPWMVKDVLAHIAAWKRNVITALDRVGPDGDPQWDLFVTTILGLDYEEFNHGVFLRWRVKSVDEVITEHRRAHADLLARLRSLDEGPRHLVPSDTRLLYPAIQHSRAHRLHLLRVAM
jgi:hypothetical protein